jgi:hypothetical protein
MNTEKYSRNPYFVPPADFDPVTEGIRLRVEASKHYLLDISSPSRRDRGRYIK